ncbi:hypothetical protein [Companilactobacillus mishanensis]|uniref:DUF1659 domain-containing protein n=1 Tax=Companilactobacillus mishanensis TaxID=2486008 RepID=A0A5P0ZK01_9LACO|nr:hypothetical protein [Companilactobacillus mishanensis]MQS45244.1 hypothetical protein [Companilactobacillus mishanensis]MQS53420.1 hypothetical protein [Companilactobacillus mishanensis]
MDWEKTSIRVTMANDKNYEKGYIVRTFNNIVPNPTQEQINLLGEALELISKGDKFQKAEVVLHNKYITQ